VAKLADARDLKSRVPKGTYRFNSGPGHYIKPCPCSCLLRLVLNGTLLSARCTDISEEGLAAFVSAELDVGTAVTFILTLPEGPTSIRLRAIVNYRIEQCHGFKFVFSSDREREFVYRYLADLRSSTIALKQPK
jgi:PilZ domain